MATQATPQIPTMQPQPTPQSFTPQSNIIWVNNEQEINNYPSGRGWQQLFGDKNKNMFYIRETDLNGVTQPIRRLSYTFEDQTQQAPAPVPASAGLAAGEIVKSPMPGNVLKINVSVGQKVNEGDVLLILEAMKMENEIAATRSGTVAQVVVAAGTVVETGSPLIVIA